MGRSFYYLGTWGVRKVTYESILYQKCHTERLIPYCLVSHGPESRETKTSAILKIVISEFTAIETP